MKIDPRLSAMLLKADQEKLEGKKKKPKKLRDPIVPDYTLEGILPRMMVTPDKGETKFIVKSLLKSSIGDRSTPKETWTRCLLLSQLCPGGRDAYVTASDWEAGHWTILDTLPF